MCNIHPLSAEKHGLHCALESAVVEVGQKLGPKEPLGKQCLATRAHSCTRPPVMLCRATCDWLGSALGNCELDVGVYHAGKDAARRRKVSAS